MPRLFTGLEIPGDVTMDLDLMRGGIMGGRWIDRESFHITLRFIGDIGDSLAREIAYELDGVEASGFSSALPEDFPAIGRDFFRVDGDDDALASEAFRAR